MDAYEGMGNSLSLQYGGSEAHTAFFQRQRGDWEAATQSRCGGVAGRAGKAGWVGRQSKRMCISTYQLGRRA